MKHKDHPLNKNKILCGFYEGKPVLFRAESSYYESSGTQIDFNAYEIIAYTPCGVRINNYTNKGRFVNLRAVKQWASPTMQEAVDQLRYRKVAQVRHLHRALDNARSALGLLNVSFDELERPKFAALFGPLT